METATREKRSRRKQYLETAMRETRRRRTNWHGLLGVRKVMHGGIVLNAAGASDVDATF